MKFPFTLLVLALATFNTNLGAAEVTYQDTFECKAGEAGNPLDLRNIGSSQTAWEASSNVLIADGNGLQIADQNPFTCRVALPPDAKEVTVEVELKPSAGQGWVALAIGGATIPAGNPSFGGLFLLVREGGLYSVMINPDPEDTRASKAIALKGGKIQGWNPDGLNSVKLILNQTAGTVSAYANGDELIADEVSFKDKGITVDAGYAGFSGVFQSGEARSFGKFELTSK